MIHTTMYVRAYFYQSYNMNVIDKVTMTSHIVQEVKKMELAMN